MSSAALALSLIRLGTRGVLPGSQSSSNNFFPCLRALNLSSGSVIVFSYKMGEVAFPQTSNSYELLCLARIIARMSCALSLDGSAVSTGAATGVSTAGAVSTTGVAT